LPSRLLTAPGVGCPSPVKTLRPRLLGLAPSLAGATCEVLTLRLLYGLPPSATEDFFWEVVYSRPGGRLVTELESSDGAAHPSGGSAAAVHEHWAAGTAEATASPHSVTERAASPSESSAAAPHVATVAAAPLDGGTAATVARTCGAPPGPSRATTTLAWAASVSVASTLHDSSSMTSSSMITSSVGRPSPSSLPRRLRFTLRCMAVPRSSNPSASRASTSRSVARAPC
jgi:hypothetical protein